MSADQSSPIMTGVVRVMLKLPPESPPTLPMNAMNSSRPWYQPESRLCPGTSQTMSSDQYCAIWSGSPVISASYAFATRSGVSCVVCVASATVPSSVGQALGKRLEAVCPPEVVVDAVLVGGVDLHVRDLVVADRVDAAGREEVLLPVDPAV